MKKVLFVIRELCGGGAERALSNIVTHFPEDWEIDILLNNKNHIDYPYKGNILSLEIPEPKSRKSLLHQGKAIHRRIRVLKKLKRENQYAACVSFLDSSNIANILSGKKYGKTIVSIRANMTSDKSNLLYQLSAWALMKLLYKKADKIVAVSKEIEDSMKKSFSINENLITSIVNGYDCSVIEKAGEEPLEKEEEKLFLAGRTIFTVGRLDLPKGQWHLIRAFKKVTESIADVKLVILGDGEQREYLQELITAYTLKERVILQGFASNPFRMLQRCDVFVLPSLTEGFPNALAEAICCGSPCIATDFHSGAREILAPDMDVSGERVKTITEVSYGILTPVCSGKKYSVEDKLEKQEEELAEAMILLLQNKGKNEYYRRLSCERRKTLDIETIVKKWISVIEG